MNRQRIGCLVFVLVIICMVMGYSYKRYKDNFREFTVFTSIKEGSSNYERTSIKVIVNLWRYDIDEMFDKVFEYQVRINGESDELRIELYNSKKDLFDCKPVEERVFYKDQEE